MANNAPNLIRPYLSIVLTMTFWAVSYVWTKIVYEIYEPITTVLLRLIIGTAFLLLLAKVLKKLQRIDKSDLKLFVLLSLLQPFLYFLFENFGLKYVSPTVAAVIISTIPLFTPFAAVYFLKERFSFLNFAGLGVSFIGVLLVVIKGDFTLSASLGGLLLLFAAVAVGVTYTTSVKQVTEKYNAITIVTYQNLFGIVWFTPLFLIFESEQFFHTMPTLKPVLALILLAFLSTSLAFVLFAYSIKHLGAARASLFGNTMPVITAIFSWFVLGEVLTIQMIVGIVIVVAGLFLSQFRH